MLTSCPVGAVGERATDHPLDEFLTVEYMPIINLANGAVASCEALARWHTAEGVILPGTAFAAGADPDHVSLSVLELVTQDADQLLPVSVNMSVDLFCAPGTLVMALESCARTGLQSSRLTVEILEGQPMDTQAAQDASTSWQRHGFGVAIDDFGAGYADHTAVANIRPTMVKVDMRVVQRRAENIIRSALDSARATGASVVAEGIETKADERWVRSFGVEFGQGWLY